MIPGFVRKSPLIAALVFLGCGKDTSGPAAVPTTVAVGPGAAATAPAGSVVTPPITFSVKDQNGNAMAGVPVTITVTGGGTIANPPTTTTGGETSIGTWTLGTAVGVNTVTIKAGSLEPVTFSVTTVAGPPSKIVVVSGSGQSGLAGSTLAPITVRVTDQFGNGVGVRPVTLSVADGGGVVVPSTGTTDSNGQLAGIFWTLGKSALPQTLAISSEAVAGTVSAVVQTEYQLEVRYFDSDPSPDVRSAFDKAAARIRGAIVGTLGSVFFNNVPLGDSTKPNTNCGVTGVTLNEMVRDVIIFAQIKPIDGPGKVLGSAGPCLVRNTSRLTVIGVMHFDSDDLASLAVPVGSGPTRLEQVILHEMSHVVGFGTLWSDITPPLLSGAGSPDPRFTGTSASAQCSAAGGTTLCAGGVAVENCIGIANCGQGTQDSHWREGNSTTPGFRTELMTGFISSGIVNPYSNITIQSLGDIGYTVNGLAADPYIVVGPTLRALLQLDGSAVNILQGEKIRIPQAMVSRNGVITRMERQ